MTSTKASPRPTRKRLRQSTLNSLANIPEGVEGTRSKRHAAGSSLISGTWNEETKGLMVFEPNAWKEPNTTAGKTNTPLKIAAFDLDSTIITTKSRYRFPKSATDWRLLNSKVAPRITSLVADNYVIVIFTNQAGVSNGRINQSFVRKRIEGITSALDIPVGVYVATSKDNFRKPGTGMWDVLMTTIGGLENVDMKSSFYVGDAAGRVARPGRTADFSDSDLRFAVNIGISFKTPEQFFLEKEEEAVSPDQLKGFDPRKLITAGSGTAYVNDAAQADALLHRIVTPPQTLELLMRGSTSPPDTPSQQMMVLMHGYPASGKSTFVKRFLLPRGYACVSHDVLQTFSRSARASREALSEGRSLVVDNCNPTRQAREDYVKIAKSVAPNVKIVCLVMNTSQQIAHHLNIVRERESKGASPHVPYVVYHSHTKRLQEPSVEEGIDEIGHVEFVPSFTSDEEKYMFTRLT